MKKIIASLLALTLISPLVASANPGGWGPGGPGPGWHGGHGGPGPLNFLPSAAEAVLIGGLTYYLLNGSYYQRQGDTYVVVDRPPVDRSPAPMHALDYNGERFYVADGHYYRRDISGDYLEVPRPPGL
ncbi:DUF6515 family protein [Pantoea sp. B65]|uniref:DUF6515 family protein n=1 Tax=Pantoea sp. B65 TaxID=2813359 RepID=UPI0039B6488F